MMILQEDSTVSGTINFYSVDWLPCTKKAKQFVPFDCTLISQQNVIRDGPILLTEFLEKYDAKSKILEK